MSQYWLQGFTFSIIQLRDHPFSGLLFQINGEAEKILKEFSIPKKGRLVSFPSFQTINDVTDRLFLVLPMNILKQ